VNQRPPFSPYFAIAIGILAVSTASIFIRYAQVDVPSLVIAAYRLSLAALFLAPLAIRHRHELSRLTRRDLLLTVLSGGFLALHFASWITSLEYTTVASSVVLVTTTPLWVALLSPIFLHESITRRVATGMLVALLGGAIIGISDACQLSPAGLACTSLGDLLTGSTFWGNFLALFGAWMAAGYLIVGRRVRAKLSLVAYVFLVYSVAAIILVGMALGAGYSLTGYPSQAYLWLVLLAAVPQLVGHSIFNWALAYLPASYVAVTLLGEPIGSTILAYFLLDETPGGVKMIGAILILIGIGLASQVKNTPAEVVESAARAATEM
jgi:drug/metabolite transporter (DMT)-like permease